MTTQKSPYEVCPVYESEHFLLKLVSPDDAEDLMVCYNDPEAQEFFNSDNCDFGYDNADTVEKIQYNIKLWLDAYHNKQFIRFSIFDKTDKKVIGTVEMFSVKYGVLRIDIIPEHENTNSLSELLKIADNFFSDFDCENIVTKAVPKADRRIAALKQCGYVPFNKSKAFDRDNYYIKKNVL